MLIWSFPAFFVVVASNFTEGGRESCIQPKCVDSLHRQANNLKRRTWLAENDESRVYGFWSSILVV